MYLELSRSGAETFSRAVSCLYRINEYATIFPKSDGVCGILFYFNAQGSLLSRFSKTVIACTIESMTFTLAGDLLSKHLPDCLRIIHIHSRPVLEIYVSRSQRGYREGARLSAVSNSERKSFLPYSSLT